MASCGRPTGDGFRREWLAEPLKRAWKFEVVGFRSLGPIQIPTNQFCANINVEAWITRSTTH